jgi:hypothetical protein
MKGFKIGVYSLLLVLAVGLQGAMAQITYTPRKLHLEAPKQVFLPSVTSPSYVFVLGAGNTQPPSTCVLKSPVHYTAFFCKMEVKTQQTLGIMVKVHAGDYDTYTTGTDQPQP